MTESNLVNTPIMPNSIEGASISERSTDNQSFSNFYSSYPFEENPYNQNISSSTTWKKDSTSSMNSAQTDYPYPMTPRSATHTMTMDYGMDTSMNTGFSNPNMNFSTTHQSFPSIGQPKQSSSFSQSSFSQSQMLSSHVSSGLNSSPYSSNSSMNLPINSSSKNNSSFCNVENAREFIPVNVKNNSAKYDDYQGRKDTPTNKRPKKKSGRVGTFHYSLCLDDPAFSWNDHRLWENRWRPSNHVDDSKHPQWVIDGLNVFIV